MVNRIIREGGSDPTSSPFSSIITQTQKNNLDSITITGNLQFELNQEDTIDYQLVDGTSIFKGVTRDTANSQINTITGFDFGISVAEAPIQRNYEDMTPLEIFEDVVNNYTDLTFQNSNVSTNQQIPLYSTPNKTVYNVLEDMHRLLGTTHYVDGEKVLHIEYEGETTNNIILEVNNNCYLDSDWISDSSSLCQCATVNGDVVLTTEEEFFSGDGTETEFTIQNAYVDIRVEHPVGTILTPSIPDVRNGDYQVRKETGKIIFNNAPSSGTNNIKVTSTYELQSNFSIPNSERTQTEGNIHHRIINRKFLKSANECREYAQRYVEKFRNPIRSVTLIYQTNPNETSIRPNQIIRVRDNFHNINGNQVNDLFLVKSVIREYGARGTKLKIEVGDSDNFIFDRETEIKQRIIDYNETNPTRNIFNVGIETQQINDVIVEFETEVILRVADLPNDVLVYDANRTYTNKSDLTNPEIQKYRYINEEDYNNLFN